MGRRPVLGTGIAVSPEEAQRVTCALLAFAFARVRTVDEVIAEIQAASRGAGRRKA